jgi:hypothetical protein
MVQYSPSFARTAYTNSSPYSTRAYNVREYSREEPAAVRVIRAAPSTAHIRSISSPSRYEPRSLTRPSAIPGGLPGPNGDYVGELGRAAWKVLHATAEQYPSNPTPQEQQTARDFLYSFAALYPCLKCRQHFQQLIREYPPDVSSQAAFVAWVIRIHDQVNLHLGKPTWA